MICRMWIDCLNVLNEFVYDIKISNIVFGKSGKLCLFVGGNKLYFYNVW